VKKLEVAKANKIKLFRYYGTSLDEFIKEFEKFFKDN